MSLQKVLIRILLIASFGLLEWFPVHAQFVQQGGKMIGTGCAAYQGWSVSTSSDGNTAIVGGPFDNSNSGAAWIFTRANGVWSQQGSKLVGTWAAGAAYQGGSVALSSDGKTAIVGGPSDSGGVGAAWIFTLISGVWSQQGKKLVGYGAMGAANQGCFFRLKSAHFSA